MNLVASPSPSPNEAALLQWPSKLYVETTTRCNLSCPMCVKYSGDSNIANEHMSVQTFERLIPAFSKLDSLVLNGIGEALMHPQLDDFIAIGKRHMPAGAMIGFQSNGLLLSDARADSLIAAGLNCLCLSVDALTPDIFSRVRRGGEVSNVETAITALADARRRSRADLRIGIQCVARRDNLDELPHILTWGAQHGADFVIVSQLMPYSRGQLDQRGYGYNSDAALALYGKWQKIAREKGVDLDDYLDKVWSADRVKHLPLIGLVEQMLNEAREAEISLNLNQLLAHDAEQARRTAETFERMKDSADRYGLELRLPAVVPRDRRSCSFIEDGSAFISWDGTLYPCYNLWHGYRSYFDDWQQLTSARSFGNLHERDLLALWNSEEFTYFRRQVLAHDYPNCSNCSVVPCDYIEDDVFEQDCYLNQQPCGMCLWAMGLLQCLQ